MENKVSVDSDKLLLIASEIMRICGILQWVEAVDQDIDVPHEAQKINELAEYLVLIAQGGKSHHE